MTLSIALENAALVGAMAVALWLASVRLRDVSIVDPFWSLFFLVQTVNTARHGAWTPGKLLLVGCVAAWSLRLFAHLFRRCLGKPEDPRYRAFRERFGPERYWWFSFFQVFLLQGVLAYVIAMPLVVAASAPEPDPIGWLDALGAIVFVVGFLFEALGDAQLDRFRRDPHSRGKVLDTGLFAWTRHPNYFGDALLWWGFGLMALDRPWGAVALAGPALMTFLLVRVSGVSLLDEHLSKTRPGYAEYIRRTSGFVPRRPRRVDGK
jgi:steroid 5-alpha reductase family enzyme